jgi:DNA polymerase (family 10)
MIAKGENKVSFYLGNGLQVDVRLLPTSQLWRGAAVLYRLEDAQRVAAAASAEDGLHAERVGAGAAGRWRIRPWRLPTEEEIYAALGMDWMPPSCARTWARLRRRAPHAAQAD